MAELSPEAAKFASKTTKGKYDEARKAERVARGIPFDIGTTGHGIVSDVELSMTERRGKKFPQGRVHIKVETPESGRGKQLTLYQDIKDSERAGSDWSAEDAFGMWLGQLETLGCPKDITTGYDDLQEVLDWFTNEPRQVSWEIVANDYVDGSGNKRQGKQIRAYGVVSEDEIPSADESPAPQASSNGSDLPEHIGTCSYRQGPHLVVRDHGETLDLFGVNSQREREGVDKDDVEKLVIF